MYSRHSLGTRNSEAALEESSATLSMPLWLGLGDIHLCTQRATGVCGGHWSAGFRMPCTSALTPMRLSSLESCTGDDTRSS
jgi:hypothetical protein